MENSRITRPSKTEAKDILRLKGGINPTIIVGEIDIGALRDYQLKEYNLQQQDKSFKPTPPNFDKNNVLKRINNESMC